MPDYGAGRMGRDGSLYEIAQWYPRLAVYDDVRGWNHEPYIGAGEFYLEYGSFDVSLTVPANYIVAATGTLRNPEVVLTPAQRYRLARAVAFGGAGGRHHRRGGGHADRTRPASGRPAHLALHRRQRPRLRLRRGAGLRWDASGYKGILVHTLYRPSAPEWEEANRMVREALQYFSEQWYRLSLSAHHQRRGPDRGHGVPDAHLRSRAPQPGGAAVGAGPRARPSVDADDRRVERAALSLDGRGVQHLHRPGRRGPLFRGDRRTATRSRSIRCISTPTTRFPGRSSR